MNLHARIEELEVDRCQLIKSNAALTAERDALEYEVDCANEELGTRLAAILELTAQRDALAAACTEALQWFGERPPADALQWPYYQAVTALIDQLEAALALVDTAGKEAT